MVLVKIILTTMIAVILLAIVVTNSVKAQTFTREPYSETVVNSPFTIYAGKNTQFSFTVPYDAVHVYLRGDMSITGGIVPILDLIVSDSTGNTHSRSTFNGYGNVNILLPPGFTYYLTVRNGAILANDDKVVSPNFVVYYDRLVPVTDMTNMTSMSNTTMGGSVDFKSTEFSNPNYGPLGSDHVHAALAVKMNGTKLDFSDNKYQVRSRYIHVENGDGNTLHRHATGVPVAEFFRSIQMNVTDNCFTDDNGTNYCSNGQENLEFYVNGNKTNSIVDYVLNDDDRILIVYNDSPIQVKQDLDQLQQSPIKK